MTSSSPSSPRPAPLATRLASDVEDRQRRLDFAFLSIAWIAIVLSVDPRGDFPLNDDWVYALGVRWTMETGRFQVPAFSNANVGPQIWWGALFAWPFGFSFDALRCSTLVFGLGGVIATYALFESLWNDRAVAFVAAATLLVNPLWLALAQTFMTDVPFYCLMAIALTCLAKGLRDGSRRFLMSGLVVGLALTAVRQFGLVVFVGFAAGYFARGPWTWRRGLVAIAPLAVAVVVHLGFSAWLLESGRKPLQEGFPLHEPYPLATAIKMVARELWDGFHLIGLLTLPLTVHVLTQAEPGRQRRVRSIAIGVVAAALLALLAVRGKRLPLGLNMLETFGMGPLTLRDSLALGLNRPEPTTRSILFWRIATVLAAVGLSGLFVAAAVGLQRLRTALGHRDRHRDRLASLWPVAFVGGVAVAYAAMMAVVVVLQYTLFDRYLLPLVLLSALVLPVLAARSARPASSSRRSMVAIGALLVAYAAFSSVAVREYLEWNRLRWQALTQLVDRDHIAPSRIDGGYEFNGWYLYDRRQWDPNGKSPWWVVDDEYVMTTGPLPGYDEIRRIPFRYVLTGTEHDLVVLRRR